MKKTFCFIALATTLFACNQPITSDTTKSKPVTDTVPEIEVGESGCLIIGVGTQNPFQLIV